MQRRASFHVRQLDCADEILALRAGLEGRPGIVDLEFDLLRAKLTVAFDDAQIDTPQIVGLITATGMDAEQWEERAADREDDWWTRHGRTLSTSLSGLFLLAGFAVHSLIAGGIVPALRGDETPLATIALYLAAAIAGAWFVAPRALAAVRLRRPDMHLLMCVAAVGAMLLNDWFEAATVSFLFGLALCLEQWSLARTRRAVAALLDLSPRTARFVCPAHGTVEERRVEEVPAGATLLVRPGDKIALDGVVVKGESHVNESPITGESIPVAKAPGSSVYAGTINSEGALEIRVTRAAGDTTLAHIVQLVEEAQSRRSPRQQWVERFARVYTPAMLALAAAIAFVPPLAAGGVWSEWMYRALVLLVIACPCALVISTPVSIVSALAAAARSGVLVKGGAALESAANLRVIAVDKTGTVTAGRPEVQELVPLNGHTTRELLERACALELHSKHPLAQAIVRRAETDGVRPDPAESFVELSGRGAEGTVGGRTFWIGSHRLMHEKGEETADTHDRALALEDAGHSVVAVGNAAHVCGLISVADVVRPGARDALDALRHAGIEKTVLLTGDNEQTARGVAQTVGVDEYRAELLPSEKVDAIAALAERYGSVAMIGDGINDAPAMARATLGVAMGVVGTDAAIETADVALMGDDLSRIAWLVHHSRRTLRVIRQNIAFALGLKLLFVALTLAGAASLWLAILADTGATLLVIANGLRLLAPRGVDSTQHTIHSTD